MSTPLLPAPCRITGRTDNSADVFTLEVQPPAADWQFSPGQFNMLYVPGAGEVAISISSDPANRESLQHTIRAVGSVTGLLHSKQADQELCLRGPYGRGWPVTECVGKDVLIVAGGIGLAPLRPVLYAIIGQRQEFGRVTLVYGARTPADILYGEQLLAWKEQGLIDLAVSVDTADADWRGDVGVVTDPLRRVQCAPDSTVAMVCGPEIMMRFVANVLRDLGLPREAIYVSMERSMKCATGFCGHCQIGPYFVCKQGPVFTYREIEPYMLVREF